MADDHTIRVILEGIDKLSGVFKGARSEVDKEIQGMRKSIQGLQKDMRDAERVPLFGGQEGFKKSGSGQVNSIAKARLEVEKLNQAIKDLKTTQKQSSSGGFFQQFKQGAAEAEDAGKRLKTALSSSREDVKERRRLLDEETRSQQIIINNRKADAKKSLNDAITARKTDLDQAIRNQKKIAAAAKDERDLARKDAIDAIDAEALRRRRAVTLESKLITTPLTQERRNLVRRKASPENAAAIAEIDKAIQAARLQKDADLETITRGGTLFSEDIPGLEPNATIPGANVEKTAVRRANTIANNNAKAAREESQAQAREELKNRSRALTQGVNEDLRITQQQFTAGQAAKGAKILTPNSADARAAEADLRRDVNAAHEADNAFQKLGRTTGLWLGDFKRGIKEGRAGLVDFGSEAQKSETLMTRIGQNVGRVVGQFGNLVNLRWFFLSSALQTIGTLVTQLASAFISVGSSAALAAAAIGTAFAAAASQALPVVGLLAAAGSRIQSVFQAVKLNQQNKIDSSTGEAGYVAQRTATEQLADAQYALVQAYQAVQEAQYNLKQSGYDLSQALQQNQEAVLNLAQTRIDVSRGLVDSYFNERDAALQLRDAELQVVDAKRQLIEMEKEQKLNQADINAAKGEVRTAEQELKAAKAEGDAVKIAQATAQLSVAQSSLSQISITARTTNTAVKEAKLGVDQAQEGVAKARVDKKRTDEDSARTRKQGITGNRDYIAAQREVAASLHAIKDAQHEQVTNSRAVTAALHAEAIAQRSLKDLEHDRAAGIVGNIPGQNQLKALLATFTPSEKQLYDSLVKLEAVYKKAMRPITDIIVSAVARAVDRIIPLLKDPKIAAAATTLATAIAHGIDAVSKFATSPKVSKDLVFFITQAAQNMPLVVKAFLNLADALLKVAKVGAPLFHNFLEFADKLSGKVDKFTNSKQGDSFFSLSKTNLDAWLKLGGAIGRILLDLSKGANKSGLGLLGQLTTFLDHISDWMDKHPKKVQAFFDQMAASLGKVAHALVPLAKALFQFFTSKEATDYVIFIIQVVIPGLLLMAHTIQIVTAGFLTLTHIPILGHFLKIAAEFLVAEKAMNKVFPVTQKITDAFKLLAKATIGGGLIKFIGEFKAFASIAKDVGIIETLTTLFPALGVAVDLAFGPVGIAVAAITAIIAAVVLLNAKFHFMTPTIKALQTAFTDMFNWIKDHWKLLTAIFLGPLGLIIDAIATHWKFIKKQFTSGFKELTKDIESFTKWAIKFLTVFATDTYNWLIKPWLDIAKWFLGIGEWVWDNIFRPLLAAVGINLGPGSKIADGIFNGFIGAFEAIAKWFEGIGSWLQKNVIQPFLDFFGIHSPSKLMYSYGLDIAQGLINGIMHLLTGLPGMIIGLFTGLGKSIANEIKKGIPSVNAIKSFFGDGSVNEDSVAKSLVAGKNQGHRTQSQIDVINALGNPTNSANQKKILSKIDPATLKILKARYHEFGRPLKKAKGGIIYAAGGHDGGLEKYEGGPFAQGTDTVPAMLTPGEWVVNKMQQNYVAKALGTSTDALARVLFNSGLTQGTGPNQNVLGLPGGGISGAADFALTPTGNKLNSNYEAYSGPNFQLTPSTDQNGQVVWFAEFKDGTFGQVTVRDANRILASNGDFIPRYLGRSAGGHGGLMPGVLKRPKNVIKGLKGAAGQRRRNQYALGGVVTGGAARFASGGVVVNRPSGSKHSSVHQEFNVSTKGETDWNYVMRLGAIHAQEGF